MAGELLSEAEGAFEEGLFVKAIYLSKLALAAATKGASPRCRIPASPLLLLQVRGWLEAALQRARTLSHSLGLGEEIEVSLREAGEALRTASKADAGNTAFEFALALCHRAYERLTEAERELKTGGRLSR